LTIKGGYLSNGGEIGLPATNEDGSYAEYRDQYLTLASDSVTIGQGGVDATSRIRLDLGGVDSTIVIYDTADDDVPTCLIKSSAGVSSSDGTPSSTTIEILGGEVGLGIYEDDDFEIDTLQVTGTAEVWVGGDVTLDSATISGGVTQIHCTPSGTLKINDGEVHAFGGVANAAGVLDINGGRCYYYSTIQPNSVNVEGTNSTRGVLDLSRDVSSRTMPLTIGAGGEVFDPYLTRSGAVTANGSIVAG